jgi:hypothetical protein
VAASDIAGDDYSGSPIVEFQMSGSALQAKIPSGIPGFSSAYVKYSLSAPAAAGSDLSVDSENILFDTIVPKDANGISVKNAAGDTTNVFVANNGDVGIGTSSPAGKLDIHPGGSQTAGDLVVDPGSLGGTVYVGRISGVSNDNTNFVVRNRVGVPAFFVNSGTTNVGVGTSSPSAKLQVFSDEPTIPAIVRLTNSSTAYAGILLESNAGLAFIRKNSTTASSYAQDLEIVNVSVGVRLAEGANSWTSSSDIRVKENWKDLNNALGIIKNWRTGTFNYIEQPLDRKAVGLIAQDVITTLPEVVDQANSDELGIRYTEVIPVLVKAIQELSAKNEELEARLAALESK